jgi:putative transposase
MRYRRLRVDGASYFFTVVTHDRRRLLVDPEAIALLERAQALVQSRHRFEIEAQVILPDHLHAIWQLPAGDADFAGRWRLIKGTFTRWYLKARPKPPRSESRKVKQEQAVWQRRYWEHLIRDEADFGAHLDYIHYNPVKHSLVSAPREWPYSTFRAWVEKGAYEIEWGSTEGPKLPDWAGRE